MTNGKAEISASEPTTSEPRTSERVRVTLPISTVEILRQEADRQDRAVANLVYTYLKESPSFQKVMRRAGRPVRGGSR